MADTAGPPLLVNSMRFAFTELILCNITDKVIWVKVCCIQYSWARVLTDKATNPQFPCKIRWNFNKFLLDRKGSIVARFDSKDDPLGDKVPHLVEGVLDR